MIIIDNLISYNYLHYLHASIFSLHSNVFTQYYRTLIIQNDDNSMVEMVAVTVLT